MEVAVGVIIWLFYYVEFEMMKPRTSSSTLRLYTDYREVGEVLYETAGCDVHCGGGLPLPGRPARTPRRTRAPVIGHDSAGVIAKC